MEQPQPQSQSNSRKQQPTVDLFEDFDFKPLSEGLGFHHGNKATEAVKEATRVMVERSAHNTRQPVRQVHPFEQHKLEITTLANAPKEFVQNDLALFYNNKQAPVVELHREEVTEKIASKSLRLAAFVIDMALISALSIITIESVSLLTGLPFWLELFAFDSLTVSNLGVLFSAYFILYFTLLEKFQGRSLGKDLIGLSLSTTTNLPMMKIFFRALLTLAGFVSFGLTNAVDVPSKITGTKVVHL